MKRLEIALIVLGILITAMMASNAALACMDHEEWPEPSEAPPVVEIGQEGDYCEFQEGDCAEGLECTGLPCMTEPCDPDDKDCEGGETLCPMGGICSATEVEPSCETDADCGSEAYACEFAEECECTAGFIAVGEEDEPTEGEDCTCTTSEVGYCQLVEKTCETNADCTGAYEGFECVDIRPPGLCFIDSEGGEEWCSEGEGSKLCVSTSIAPPPGKNFPDTKNTGNNGSETATDSASGGCTIGHGAGAGGAVLPMLVLLVGWITRRRLAMTL